MNPSVFRQYDAGREDLGGGLYDFRLTIHRVDQKHFRQYELEVVNEVGTATDTLRLKEGRRPAEGSVNTRLDERTPRRHAAMRQCARFCYN